MFEIGYLLTTKVVKQILIIMLNQRCLLLMRAIHTTELSRDIQKHLVTSKRSATAGITARPDIFQLLITQVISQEVNLSFFDMLTIHIHVVVAVEGGRMAAENILFGLWDNIRSNVKSFVD